MNITEKTKKMKPCFTKPHPVLADALVSGFAAFVILWLMFALKGYVPFGGVSLACKDANNQYLDLFCWLKNVLSGEDSLTYSFSKSLGGPTIGIYSYYLASPFSLLVVFFDKADLHTFFDIAVSLKLALAGALCSVFLHCRLTSGRVMEPQRRVLLVLLSVSYALGQYSIAQASNIMWLDGVYMLPLILLGVSRLVREKKGTLLAVAVGCSILFNWYTGGINGLFAIIWFLFEMALVFFDGAGHRSSFVRLFFSSVLRFACFMLVGVMLSGILFLPTVGAMLGSARGEFEAGLLKNWSFIGNPASVIEAYLPGAKSTTGTVSLYAGSLPLLGCIGFFLKRGIASKKKWVYAGLLIVTLLAFYWNPLYTLFSLLKQVYSFYCRFSYAGILVLVFIAAELFLFAKPVSIRRPVIIAAASFSAALLIISLIKDDADTGMIFREVLLIAVCTVCLLLFMHACSGSANIGLRRIVPVYILICAFFLLETGYGTGKLMTGYNADNVDEYIEYVQQEREQIDWIKANDQSAYRITQTSARMANKYGLMAHYNEGMVYGYMPICNYTSAPDNNVLSLLDSLGYRRNGLNLSIVNSPILGADSLLGVKYVLSDYPVSGLISLGGQTVRNGKTIYENPYALPIAFTYSSDHGVGNDAMLDTDLGVISGAENPFENQNRIFRALSGSGEDIYIPLNFTVSSDDSRTLVYSIEVPSGDFAVYGDLPWDKEYEGMADVNGVYSTGYAMWLSPSVFYIPGNQSADQDKIDDGKYCVSVTAEKELVSNGREQFYGLDLNKLRKVTDLLKTKAASVIRLVNGGAVHIEAEADGTDDRLFLSIPYNEGFCVTRNGKEIETEVVGGCLYSIPLESGTNSIDMTFSVKYTGIGLACSALGVVLLAAYSLFGRRRRYSNGSSF